MKFNSGYTDERIKKHNEKVLKDEALNEIELVLEKYKKYINYEAFKELLKKER